MLIDPRTHELSFVSEKPVDIRHESVELLTPSIFAEQKLHSLRQRLLTYRLHHVSLPVIHQFGKLG